MAQRESKESGGRPKRAIVLSGGAARGAYEAGVLAYMFNELPKQLLKSSRVQLISGTSVGAVHAAFLAANAHVPHRNMGRMLHLWRSLDPKAMLKLSTGDLLRLPLDLRRVFRNEAVRRGILIQSQNLQSVVLKETDWSSIRKNLLAGELEALTVTATHAVSGRSVVFVDRADEQLPVWNRDLRTVARAVKIGPRHTLASAAIPFLFPSVKIDGSYYVDGGLRQNTPLSPVLRMGADKVLVISLRHEEREVPKLVHRANEGESYPGTMLLLGKIMDALMLDHTDYDLARLEGFNLLLQEGQRAFGSEFASRMDGIATRMRGARYRHIEACCVRPSRDLGEMATEFLHSHRKDYGGMAGKVLNWMAASDFLKESDLLSYVLFDGRFSEALIELGHADADASREQLIDFLKD